MGMRRVDTSNIILTLGMRILNIFTNNRINLHTRYIIVSSNLIVASDLIARTGVLRRDLIIAARCPAVIIHYI